jgi:RNA polymerase sigma-70 factor (ECF subfamily)
MAAANNGDVQAVLAMLAPDVTWTADSGGKASAARRPVVGAEKVAKVVLGLLRSAGELADARVELATCNSAPTVLVHSGDQMEGIFTLDIIDGRITNLYAMRNPDKLAALATTREISRI